VGGEVFDARHVVHLSDVAVGQRHAAGPEHPWMGEIGNPFCAVASADGIQGEQHGARMIPMAMGQHDAFDNAEIYAQTRRVSLERVILRTAVE